MNILEEFEKESYTKVNPLVFIKQFVNLILQNLILLEYSFLSKLVYFYHEDLVNWIAPYLLGKKQNLGHEE